MVMENSCEIPEKREMKRWPSCAPYMCCENWLVNGRWLYLPYLCQYWVHHSFKCCNACADDQQSKRFVKCPHVLTVSMENGRRYSFLQLEQRSAKQLPCSSAILSRGTPERRCSPSTFWLTTKTTFPQATSAEIAWGKTRQRITAKPTVVVSPQSDRVFEDSQCSRKVPGICQCLYSFTAQHLTVVIVLNLSWMCHGTLKSYCKFEIHLLPAPNTEHVPRSAKVLCTTVHVFAVIWLFG